MSTANPETGLSAKSAPIQIPAEGNRPPTSIKSKEIGNARVEAASSRFEVPKRLEAASTLEMEAASSFSGWGEESI